MTKLKRRKINLVVVSNGLPPLHTPPLHTPPLHTLSLHTHIGGGRTKATFSHKDGCHSLRNTECRKIKSKSFVARLSYVLVFAALLFFPDSFSGSSLCLICLHRCLLFSALYFLYLIDLPTSQVPQSLRSAHCHISYRQARNGQLGNGILVHQQNRRCSCWVVFLRK